VAKTTLKGARKEQYNIQVDMGKLEAYHLSLGQIMQAVQSVAVNVPDIKGRTEENKLIIFGVKNAIESVKDVKNIMVAQYMGSPVYLKDVASVESGIDIQNFQTASILFKDKTSKENDHEHLSRKMNDERTQITLTVAKLAGTNAVFVAEDVLEVLNAHKHEFERLGMGYIVTRNYGERANEAVNELMHHLIITIVIIALMLVFALGWRESMIVTFTVPAILAVTLFVAWMSGQTMNRITIGTFIVMG
jgi:multidrug efflux pump subunit AcrB